MEYAERGGLTHLPKFAVGTSAPAEHGAAGIEPSTARYAANFSHSLWLVIIHINKESHPIKVYRRHVARVGGAAAVLRSRVCVMNERTAQRPLRHKFTINLAKIASLFTVSPKPSPSSRASPLCLASHQLAYCWRQIDSLPTWPSVRWERRWLADPKLFLICCTSSLMFNMKSIRLEEEWQFASYCYGSTRTRCSSRLYSLLAEHLSLGTLPRGCGVTHGWVCCWANEEWSEWCEHVQAYFFVQSKFTAIVLLIAQNLGYKCGNC